MPFASPNVVASIYDVTLPEVRSTALSIQYFIEEAGAAVAPLLAGLVADRFSLHQAILGICVAAWLLGSGFLALATRVIPADIATLRSQLAARAQGQPTSG